MLTTVQDLTFDEASARVRDGACWIDVREWSDYLDVHIPGSICLHYESGPGLPGRARECVPLEVPLVLMDEGHGDTRNVAASLRGKGFVVLGSVGGALAAWSAQNGHPASTEVVDSPDPSDLILDVKDPGAARFREVTALPVERLWWEIGSVATDRRVVVLAGRGVRAALAVGILERHGIEPVVWRPRGSS